MVLTLTGILFVAESLTSDGIPEMSEQALWLWITFVEVMTAMILVTGIIFLISRDIEISCTKKVLMEAVISFLKIIAVMIFYLIKNDDIQVGKPPIPLMIVFAVLAS